MTGWRSYAGLHSEAGRIASRSVCVGSSLAAQKRAADLRSCSFITPSGDSDPSARPLRS